MDERDESAADEHESGPMSQMRKNAPYDVAIHEAHEVPAVSTRYHDDPADLAIASVAAPVVGSDPAVERERAPRSKGASIAWMVVVVAAGLVAAYLYTRMR